MAQPDTLNQAWAKDTTSFGYQMLFKMGWKQGKGLGKNEDGMAAQIKVTRKTETVGLGCERQDEFGNSSFVKQITSFNEILEQLNQEHTQIGSDDTQQSSDSEVVKAKQKTTKRAKKSKRKAPVTADGERPKKVVRQHEVLVRRKHTKMLVSKNVASYSSHDLRAILGG